MNKRKQFVVQYIVIGTFLSFIGLSLVCGIATQIIKSSKYSKEIMVLKDEIKKTDKEIKNLKEEKVKLDNEKYIEDIARNRLKMVKQNEIIYIDINKGSS